jgi:hypothetical protein
MKVGVICILFGVQSPLSSGKSAATLSTFVTGFWINVSGEIQDLETENLQNGIFGFYRERKSVRVLYKLAFSS